MYGLAAALFIASAKTALANIALLTHLVSDAPLRAMIYASDVVVGAIFQQKFWSRGAHCHFPHNGYNQQKHVTAH